MKFFIPAAKNEQNAELLYSSLKKRLSQTVGTDFDDRRIYQLNFSHEGKDYSAKVGETTDFNHELVIAILHSPGRDLYQVCTPNRGVERGISILVGGHAVAFSSDFEK